MFRQFKIAHRLVAATVVAITLVLSVTFLLVLRNVTGVLDRLEESALQELVENILTEVESEGLRAQSMAALVAGIPQVQEAFAAADRAALQGYFAGGFAGLKQHFGVRQFQFHQPPATSFLRVHKVEKFGDDLSSFRHTVVQTNDRRVPIRGLEVGVAGLGIRGIVPVTHDGRHVGSVEFGLSLAQDFVDRVAAAHDIQLAVHLERGGRFEQLAASARGAELVNPADLAGIVGAGSRFQQTELGDTPVAVLAQKILDFEGKPIGVIAVGKDRTEHQEQIAGITVQAVVLGVGSVVVLAMIVLLIASGVVRPLCATTRSLEGIAYGTGSLADRLDETGNDEISALARAYNAFIGKLENTINAVVDTTNELAGMATHFTSLSDHTSRGVMQQQQQVTQVATAMTEMSATVHEVAQNTVDTAEAASHVDQQANAGQAVVKQAMDSINGLAEEVGHAVERIRLVEQDSERIGSVLDVIRGIADQTNLLALNAAIEAARAGEQGRGFAVVADEVRTLAQRTQHSTREIQEMIESLQSGVDKTVGVLETSKQQAADSVQQSAQAHEALVAITGSIDRITAMSSQIATAAEEQSAVAEDINRNVAEITQVAEQTADDARKSVAETGQLGRAVESLVGLMGQFRTGR